MKNCKNFNYIINKLILSISSNKKTSEEKNYRINKLCFC